VAERSSIAFAGQVVPSFRHSRVNVALQDLLRTRCLRLPAANQWFVTHRTQFFEILWCDIRRDAR
jgi:hypothetical protein